MADEETFDLPQPADDAIMPMRDEVFRAASNWTDLMQALGATERQASSVVANLMLESAFAVACIGAALEGKEPSPERFLAAAEAAIKRVSIENIKKIAEATNG